jgi:hypothetical protein
MVHSVLGLTVTWLCLLHPTAGYTKTAAKNKCPNTPNVIDGDGFYDFMVLLRNLVTDFKRPVTYVHGDSHVFM